MGGSPLIPLIAAAARQEGADLLCLAESEDPVPELTLALNAGEQRLYSVPLGLPLNLRRELRILSRLPADAVMPLYDDHGITVRAVRPPVGPDFTLIAVHLRSKLYQHPADQPFAAARLGRLIDRMESRAGHRRTVVVGDLNMDPFESGVVAADGLHAVMTRSIALKLRRQVEGEDRHFLYNPMWNHFGDRNPSPPGTYYLGPSGYTSYFWHMFDQVLVRPDLLPYLDDASVRILTQIGNTSLLTGEGVPDKNQYSDHLPLVFDLNVERGLQDGIQEPVGEDQAPRI